MMVSCLIDQVIDDTKVVSKHKNDALLFAPSQGTKNVALLYCSCFRACVRISGNLFTQTWEKGDRDNLILSFLIKKQINMVKFVIKCDYF